MAFYSQQQLYRRGQQEKNECKIIELFFFNFRKKIGKKKRKNRKSLNISTGY